MPDKPYTASYGDEVIVVDPRTRLPSARFPGIWTVHDINQRSCSLRQDDKRLRCDKTLMIPAADAPPEAAGLRVPFAAGTVVHWDEADEHDAGGPLFVVLADTGGRTVDKIVPLGGGRRWSRVPARHLAEVKLGQIGDWGV